MGNMCIGGSSTAIYEPNPNDNHQEETRLRDLNNLNNSLNRLELNRTLNNREYFYLSHEAPPALKSKHNSLIRSTYSMELLARIDQSRLLGQGTVEPGLSTQTIIESLDRFSSLWGDIKSTIQTAIDEQIRRNQGNIIQNPCGSISWGHLQN